MWRQDSANDFRSFIFFFILLTCCDDFDTDDVELLDEFNRFCREASPLVVSVLATVVGDGLTAFFLLKFSKIDAISGDMFCGVLLTIIVSGSSDICKTRKNRILISLVERFAHYG